MKTLNSIEFADFLGIKFNTLRVWRTNGNKGVPNPTQHIKKDANKRPSPLWDIDVAEKFKASMKPKAKRINQELIKKMANDGFTTVEIAEKVKATSGYISNLCRKLGVKPKCRAPKSMKIQVDLWPEELKHVFNVFLRSHVKAIKSLG